MYQLKPASLRTPAEAGVNFISGMQNGVAPKDPTLYQKAQEAVKWLAEAQLLAQGLDETLFGPKPRVGDKEYARSCGLEQLLAEISTRGACLVGQLRTIQGKLGESDEAKKAPAYIEVNGPDTP